MTITRFRGVEHLDWLPQAGVNVILGGGDVGKTTILEALALLLKPSSSTQLVDSDYWLRDLEKGFIIEATFALPDSVGINQLQKMILPWEWDGGQACIPDPEGGSGQEPVYVLRVRGTQDYEAFHEIVQPDTSTEHLPVTLRRRIGVIWLGGDESDRDLRLVYGSALDRLVSDGALRARLGHRLGEEDIKEQLKDPGKDNLERLEAAFRENSLPEDLGLGLTGGRRISLNSLVGLTAKKAGERLPVSSWGSGTQRLASLQVGAANQTGAPITLVDELERGLEPHRQRGLITQLMTRGTQSFVTTHSPIVLSAAASASMWYLDPSGKIGRLLPHAVAHALKDPEAFLANVTIVAEGATEVGFLRALLERSIEVPFGAVGVLITDGEGHETALRLLESLTKAGLTVGAFVDDEGKHPERWSRVKNALGDLVFQWASGCTEQNVVPQIPEENLEQLVADPTGDKTGDRLRTLKERLRTGDKDWPTLVAASEDIHQSIVEAATGTVPDWVTDDDDPKHFKKHSQHWFKSAAGGRELAEKVITLGAWDALRSPLWQHIEAVFRAVGIEPQDPAKNGD